MAGPGEDGVRFCTSAQQVVLHERSAALGPALAGFRPEESSADPVDAQVLDARCCVTAAVDLTTTIATTCVHSHS